MENSLKGFIEILIFLNAYFLTRVSKNFFKIVQKKIHLIATNSLSFP